MKAERLQGMYVGASGSILIEYALEKRGIALQSLLNTKDHIEMVKYQTMYKLFDGIITAKDEVYGK